MLERHASQTNSQFLGLLLNGVDEGQTIDLAQPPAHVKLLVTTPRYAPEPTPFPRCLDLAFGSSLRRVAPWRNAALAHGPMAATQVPFGAAMAWTYLGHVG